MDLRRERRVIRFHLMQDDLLPRDLEMEVP